MHERTLRGCAVPCNFSLDEFSIRLPWAPRGNPPLPSMLLWQMQPGPYQSPSPLRRAPLILPVFFVGVARPLRLRML